MPGGSGGGVVVEGGEGGRGRDLHCRCHEQDAGRIADERSERRDALATALDERRSAGQEEGHVGADGDRRANPLVALDRGTPGVGRPVDRRRGVAAPAGEPRGDRDPLLEARRERERVGSAPDHDSRRRDRSQDRSEVRRIRRAAINADHVQAVVRARGSGEAEAVGQPERDHD